MPDVVTADGTGTSGAGPTDRDLPSGAHMYKDTITWFFDRPDMETLRSETESENTPGIRRPPSGKMSERRQFIKI